MCDLREMAEHHRRNRTKENEMPKLLDHVDTKPSIKLDKDDLTNRHQYGDAVSWVSSRIISPFGLVPFVSGMIHAVRVGFLVRGDIDGRRVAAKRLQAAEDALNRAALEYDQAVQAVRESFPRKKFR